MTTLLLAQDFPPRGGGIARLHGELAKRFPRGELIVSTPGDPDASEVDSGLPAIVDRLPMGVHRTKTLPADHDGRKTDRKSTRLNSSHTVISYAVFCLKKKKV